MFCYVLTIDQNGDSPAYIHGVYRNYDDGNSILNEGIRAYNEIEYKVVFSEEEKGKYHLVTMKREQDGGLDVKYVDLILEVQLLR